MCRIVQSLISFYLFVMLTGTADAEPESPWYEMGHFIPAQRIEITVVNTLDIDRPDCPIVITRDQMPVQDLHEMWVTVIDPYGVPRGEPSKERLRQYGYHEIRAEKNGRKVFHQMDDLDKDGVWDELFFIADLKAHERKKLFIYIGFNDRGWNKHTTHATIGSYCRHLVPFWESEYVGWKLWYPTDCDVFGKRVPQLMSQHLCMENFDGYGVPADMGSDIMGVSSSLGGGGIALYEHPAYPDSISRPRFTPARTEAGFTGAWNVGQISDCRFTFDVVVNGPLRSMIRIKTMNWKTGSGSYELEQTYTAYTRQNYSTCKVKYPEFLPKNEGTLFACGIKQHPNQSTYYQNGGLVLTAGSEEIVNPDDVDGIQKITVDYVGTACIVKDTYNPEYHFYPNPASDGSTGNFSWQGDHTFKIEPADDHTFEYLIAASWSEGGPYKTAEDFKNYILRVGKEYNNPAEVMVGDINTKPEE